MRQPVHILTLLAIALAVVSCGRNGADGPEPGSEEMAVSPSDTSAPTATAATPAQEGVGETGQAVFTANCATCHGDQGKGNGPAATGLEPPPADLTDSTWKTGDGSLEAIRNTIENGSPGTAMIGWKGTLTDAEIEAVARYVKGLSGS